MHNRITIMVTGNGYDITYITQAGMLTTLHVQSSKKMLRYQSRVCLAWRLCRSHA